MTQRMAVLLTALLVCVATLATPRRAAADDNLQYIIPAAIGGVVAVIGIIAIVMADRSEPEYDLVEWRLRRETARPGLHLAPECSPGPLGRPLLCW